MSMSIEEKIARAEGYCTKMRVYSCDKCHEELSGSICNEYNFSNAPEEVIDKVLELFEDGSPVESTTGKIYMIAVEGFLDTKVVIKELEVVRETDRTITVKSVNYTERISKSSLPHCLRGYANKYLITTDLEEGKIIWNDYIDGEIEEALDKVKNFKSYML